MESKSKQLQQAEQQVMQTELYTVTQGSDCDTLKSLNSSRAIDSQEEK